RGRWDRARTPPCFLYAKTSKRFHRSCRWIDKLLPEYGGVYGTLTWFSAKAMKIRGLEGTTREEQQNSCSQRKAVSAWRNTAGIRPRKSLRGLLHSVKHLDNPVDLRQPQAVVDHRLRAGDAQPAARIFQLPQTSHDGANRRAIGVRHSRHIEDYSRLPRSDHSVPLALQSRAFRPAVDAPVHDQRSHAGLQSSLGEVQDHDAARSSPSYGNCRIKRTQSPNAAKIDTPHPHGTNGAVF